MTDLKTVEAAPLVVVTRGTGDGSIPQLIQTPAGQPNILIVAVRPVATILIRTARAYLQFLVGLLTAGGLGLASNTLPVGDFWALLKVSAGLSIAPAVVCAAQNTLELLAKLDQSMPTLHG